MIVLAFLLAALGGYLHHGQWKDAACAMLLLAGASIMLKEMK